jgi:endoglycosylceramidase
MNDDDIANLQKWGMNFMRLGVMWEAVERSPGVYNETYLDEVETLINRLGEKGIYTLVDMHQDVFARHICGEGFPDFYATYEELDTDCHNTLLNPILKPILKLFGLCKSVKNDFNFDFDENDDPLISECQQHDFSGYYTSSEAQNAFRNLYENVDGLQDKFVAYWDKVSARFSNNQFVVGFDPLNEPMVAPMYENPLLLMPHKFDQESLAPMYTRIYEKYKQNNENNIMWFEPSQFPDEIGILGGLVRSLGFITPPGGEIGSDKHVLNDHSYCCQMDGKICATGQPPVEKSAKCLDWHQRRIGQRVEDASNLGVPLIISEFGACLDGKGCVEEIQNVAKVCDDNTIGWAYWQFKNFEDLTTSAGTGSEGFYSQDGEIIESKVKALTRTYLQYTQGELKSMSFDPATSNFEASFVLDIHNQDGTTIYYNTEYYYENGIDFSLAD